MSTAEGIETKEQLDLLVKKHCTEGQGYLFGRPAPASQLSTVFRVFGGEVTTSLRTA
jgi:EAL domain-containing protein (putative c-di-GMP-specific phosphodiesterase class I)